MAPSTGVDGELDDFLDDDVMERPDNEYNDYMDLENRRIVDYIVQRFRQARGERP